VSAHSIGRRGFLSAGAAVAALALTPSGRAFGAAEPTPGNPHRLVPGPATAPLLGADAPVTPVWAYNGQVPGPEIRLRQGAPLRVEVANRLGQDTTVHWHGLRLPNAMDGVPFVTQDPIPPGGRFLYEFTPPDAGTFWYHPHVRGSEQQGRGLYGALIVEEAEPPRVDREAVWVIDDWRLTEDGAIDESFGNGMDLSHAGRRGNLATLNGRDSTTFPVRAGERLRLRLINTANARIFALRFEGHRPVVIALDGQPVAPYEAEGARIVLPPAGRADLILDMAGDPGASFAVIDDYGRSPYKFLDLVYQDAAPLRASPLDLPMALPANPLPEPDLADPTRHEIVLAGGAMGSMRSAILNGEELGIRELAGLGKVWALNGVAAHQVNMPPLLTFERGRTQILTLRNDTAFPHPMHLHGFSFRVLTRNGRPNPRREWLDTVLLERDETAEIAFVADNPGDWLFHCHILEHMEAGMNAVFRVL
jgi:FtsP/CotA-like multicopper oxidase with cupredoxin domain